MPETFVLERRGSVLAAARRSDAAALDAWGLFGIERVLAEPGRIRERSTGRVAHAVVDGPGGRLDALFVREYRHGGWLGSLMGHRLIPARRPFREVVVSEHARSARVATPEIVACVGTGLAGGTRWHAILVALEGFRDLVDWLGPGAGRVSTLDRARASAERGRIAFRRRALGRLAAEVRRLHDAGICHADLHVKNLMVDLGGARDFDSDSDSEGPRVAVVDLDKSRRIGSKGLPERWRRRNLVRLDRSVEKLVRRGGGITRTERLRFLRDYHGGTLPARRELERLLRERHRALRWHALGWELSRRARRLTGRAGGGR